LVVVYSTQFEKWQCEILSSTTGKKLPKSGLAVKIEVVEV